MITHPITKRWFGVSALGRGGCVAEVDASPTAPCRFSVLR